MYPACNTNPRVRRVVLGTSRGWSDVYPPGYPEQWIDVTGLRGCFAYQHTADPRNWLHESDETNNRSTVIVRLPYRRAATSAARASEAAPRRRRRIRTTTTRAPRARPSAPAVA